MASGRRAGQPPSKPKRTQEERSSETSGKLLAAAVDLLLERGYSRFRIADAAARAKVSRGGQTHHFATKSQLIEAAIAQLFNSEVGASQVDAARSAKPELLRHAAQHAHAFFSSKTYKVSVNMLVSAGEQEPLANGVRDISARSRVPIEQAWVDRLVDSGVDRDIAHAVFGLIWGIQRGHFIERHIGGDPRGTDDAELDFAIGLLNEYLGIGPEAASNPH